MNFFFLNVTRRIESFSLRLKELNLLFFLIWLWELNTFFNTTQKKWLKKFDWEFCFLNMTQEIDFFEYDSTNWILFVWLQALNFGFQNDSKNWTFFVMTQRNWTFFLHMTQRIEYLYMIQGIELFFSISTQRIELFAIRPKQLNLFFFQTQRIEIF